MVPELLLMAYFPRLSDHTISECFRPSADIEWANSEVKVYTRVRAYIRLLKTEVHFSSMDISPDAPRAFFIERHHHHHHHYHHSSSGETIPRSQSKAPTAIHSSGGSQPGVIKHSKHHKLHPAVQTVQPAASVQHFQYSKCTGRKKALCVSVPFRVV